MNLKTNYYWLWPFKTQSLWDHKHGYSPLYHHGYSKLWILSKLLLRYDSNVTECKSFIM